MTTEAQASPADKARVEVDKPWPEPAWLWRRIYAFAATAALIYIEHEAVVQGLPWPVHACIVGLGILSLVLAYMVGATGEVWIRMSQTLGAAKAGVSISTTQTAATAGATATAKTETKPSTNLEDK